MGTIAAGKPAPVGGDFLLGGEMGRSAVAPEDLTAEDRLMGNSAEQFLSSRVMPRTDEIEQGDLELMRELMRQAGEQGLLGADVPEIYGGLGLSQPVNALIAEKLNPQQSFALTHEAHTVIATLPLLYFGSREQKRRYLPRLASGEWIGSFALSEANAGSDVLGMQTRAVRDGSGYVLNGEKMWITNTAFAHLFTVFAKVDGERASAFLVERDTPGLSFGREEHKLGMRGTSTRRVLLDNVRVPAENALEEGQGHYAAFCALNMGRFRLEAGAVGGIKFLLRLCTEYAGQRKAFGHPIGEFGLIQRKLVEMAARAFALESMVYRLAGDLETLFSNVQPDAEEAPRRYHHAAEEMAIECNVVKVIGSEAYSDLADEAIQLFGGNGYTEEFPLARAWRDQRLLRIGEGANEIVRLAITNSLRRRVRQERLFLDPAVFSLEEGLAGLETGIPTGADWLQSAAGVVCGLAVMAHRAVAERTDPDEELSAAAADLVCAAYALQSVWLRCSRLQGGRMAGQGMALGLAAAEWHARWAAAAARILRDCGGLDGGSLVDRAASALERSPRNRVELRQEAWTAIRAAGGYPV